MLDSRAGVSGSKSQRDQYLNSRNKTQFQSPNEFSWSKSTKTGVFFWPKSTEPRFFSSQNRPKPLFQSKTSVFGQIQPKPVFRSKSTKTRFCLVKKPVFPVKINQTHFFRPKSTKTSLFGKKPVFPAKIDQNQFFRSRSTKTIPNPPPSARS